MFCKINEMLNESDVEQKFLNPFITTTEPMGLGYISNDYYTKKNIKEYNIDKGASKKLYYPDYIIVSHGIPLIVIEAKHPSCELSEAYREARLYATELNSIFPTAINPCIRVVATNGKQLLAGYADTSKPAIDILHENMVPSSAIHHQLIKFLSKKNISKLAADICIKTRGTIKD